MKKKEGREGKKKAKRRAGVRAALYFETQRAASAAHFAFSKG